MDDLISRQAVLDGLASIAKAKAKSDAQKSMMGRTMFFVEQLPSVSTEKTGRWISVSKRLPEMREEIGILKKYVSMRSDEVLVTIRDNKNGSVVTHSKCYLWDGKWHGDIFDWLKASKIDYEVVAWMPLPTPFEPQESEVQDADSN